VIEHDEATGDSPAVPYPPDYDRGSALWLFYLYSSPRRFFQHFDRTATAFSTAYASLIVGVAAVMDRISTEMMRYEFTGERSSSDTLFNSWFTYWTHCLVAGVISALFFWAIGGWWYRVRLQWSGAASPDACLARRVYIFASLIADLPTFLTGIVATAMYATPGDAEYATSWADVVFLLLPFYSVFVSYRGVRTLFDVTRWKARLWFLVLPVAVYGVAIAVVAIVMALAVSGGIQVPADTARPRSIDRAGFSLDYPGNWTIDSADEDYDPDWYFSIEPVQDAVVIFEFGEPTSDVQGVTLERVANFSDVFSGEDVQHFDRWGAYEGAGAEFRGRYEGSAYTVRVFTASTASFMVSIVEIMDVETADSVEPGVELIRRTFRLKD